MIAFFKKLREDRKGNTLVIAGAVLPLLIGSAGLATDTIQWAMWKRQLQRAADSAAIAGVYDINGQGDNSGTDAAVEHDLELNHHTGLDWVVDPVITYPADDGDMTNQVNVELTVRRALPFSSMFMDAAPVILARARAASVPGSDEYCVVSLEPNANRAGITIGGNAKIEMDCGMISNSPAINSALSNGNSSEVHASVMAAVGGVQSSSSWDVDKYDPYVDAIDDPYAHVNIDRTQMNCFSSGGRFPMLGQNTSNNFNGANATVSLTTARASNPTANCFKGLTVGSGETVTLPAGTYYIGEGGINVQGTLNATAGVTLVLTNNVAATGTSVGQLDVNASATMNITAPSSGTYSGIAIYQDRAAGDSSQTNKINGNATNAIVGAVYFPKQEIDYNGGGTTGYVCTRLVGRRITFSGTAAQTNKFERGSNCPIFGNTGIGGGRRVRLVA